MHLYLKKFSNTYKSYSPQQWRDIAYGNRNAGLKEFLTNRNYRNYILENNPYGFITSWVKQPLNATYALPGIIRNIYNKNYNNASNDAISGLLGLAGTYLLGKGISASPKYIRYGLNALKNLKPAKPISNAAENIVLDLSKNNTFKNLSNYVINHPFKSAFNSGFALTSASDIYDNIKNKNLTNAGVNTVSTIGVLGSRKFLPSLAFAFAPSVFGWGESSLNNNRKQKKNINIYNNFGYSDNFANDNGSSNLSNNYSNNNESENSYAANFERNRPMYWLGEHNWMINNPYIR